jgi:hypothetical protein
MYLGKDRKCATPSMTATHATTAGLTERIERVGHKLYMGSFFSSPVLFNDFNNTTRICCGTLRPNRKGMPKNLYIQMRLKLGDKKTKVRGNLTATTWKDK